MIGRLAASCAVLLMLAVPAFGQVGPRGTLPIGPSTNPGTIAGAFTASDLLAANSAGQVADSSTACATAGCILPAALNMTQNIAYGAGAVSGPARGSGLWFNGLSGVSATGVCSDVTTCTLSSLSITNDTVDASGSANGLVAFTFQDLMGAGVKGGRRVAAFNMTIGGIPGDTNASYTAISTITQATVNDGGTVGAGNGLGQLFGLNPFVRLNSGGTFYHSIIGQETDLLIATGASAEIAIGHQIVQDPSFAVPPTRVGIAYSANNGGGATGWDLLLADGSYDGNPSLKTTGSIFGCYPHAATGNCGTIGYGIDFTNYAAITNYILRGPQANGYIDGNFDIRAIGIGPAATTTTVFPIGTSNNAVNGYCVTPTTTGVATIFASCGLDVTIPVQLKAKGSGNISLGNNNGFPLIILNSAATASLTVAGAAVNPIVSCSATNCGPNIQAAGSGSLTLTLGSTNSLLITSLASVATTSAVCYNTSTGAVSYDSSIGTCNTSTARAKHDIQPFEADALQAVLRMEPKLFFYNEDQNAPGQQLGLIAEDLEAIDPKLVGYDMQGRPNSIKFLGPMFSYMIGSIKQQQEKINMLETQLRNK